MASLPEIDDPTYELVRLAGDVFATVVRDGVSPSRFAASLIVVRDDHVLVVDSRQDAESADRLLSTIELLTDLPVRYLINTHWHGDHVQGNATFRARFPDVRIIGGATSATDIETLGRGRLDAEIGRIDARVVAAEGWLETGVTGDGTPLTEEERAALPGQIEAARAAADARRSIELVPPEITVDNELQLADASPNVEILMVGPAHTRGDVAVYLPSRGILALGDLIEDGFPYFGDGYPSGWAASLERLAGLDASTYLGAHGPVIEDRDMIETQLRFVEAVVELATMGVEAGRTLEEVAASADLSSFETHFTRRMSEATPDERTARFERFVAETLARAYVEASGDLADELEGGS